MEHVIDFLAEEELKTAEQLVAEIFDVRASRVRQCRSVIESKDSSKKARMAGKHERMTKLVVSLKAKAAGVGR